jgi:hypothetical protein
MVCQILTPGIANTIIYPDYFRKQQRYKAHQKNYNRPIKRDIFLFFPAPEGKDYAGNAKGRQTGNNR